MVIYGGSLNNQTQSGDIWSLFLPDVDMQLFEIPSGTSWGPGDIIGAIFVVIAIATCFYCMYRWMDVINRQVELLDIGLYACKSINFLTLPRVCVECGILVELVLSAEHQLDRLTSITKYVRPRIAPAEAAPAISLPDVCSVCLVRGKARRSRYILPLFANYIIGFWKQTVGL